MLTRREFLTRGTTVLLLAPAAVRCTTGTSPQYGPTPPAPSTLPPVSGCAGVSSTSTLVDAHVHALCVPTTDLTSPPVGGMVYTTSLSASHTHAVALTQAQLQAIAAGTDVRVDTASSIDPLDGLAHTHSFTIVQLASLDAGLDGGAGADANADATDAGPSPI